MKLEPKKGEYDLVEPIGQLCNICILDGEYLVQLQQISPYEFVAFEDDPKTQGIPVWFCLAKGSIYFHPIPDKEYEVRIRFYPPIREM